MKINYPRFLKSFLLIVLIGAGILVGGREARADTFYIIEDWGGQMPALVSDFSVNLNKSSYSPNETIVVTATKSAYLGAAWMQITINGGTQSSQLYPWAPMQVYFTAPGGPGGYSAQFYAEQYFNAVGWTDRASYSLPYSVYQPNRAPNPPSFWGPSSTNTNVNTGFGFYDADPDGDSMIYYVDWGDGQGGWITGWVGNGSDAWPAHYWTSPGYRTVTAYAMDQNGAWSPPSHFGVNVVPPPPVNGQCGSSNNSCTAGILSDTPDIPNASYRWDCNGTDGGSSVSCSACMTSFWTPDPSGVCSGTAFTQSSNCGETRTVTGTGAGTWTPDPSETCSYSTVTQSRCGTQRIVSGTKSCYVPGWHEIAPTE